MKEYSNSLGSIWKRCFRINVRNFILLCVADFSGKNGFKIRFYSVAGMIVYIINLFLLLKTPSYVTVKR